jgi:hypothetical protein
MLSKDENRRHDNKQTLWRKPCFYTNSIMITLSWHPGKTKLQFEYRCHAIMRHDEFRLVFEHLTAWLPGF